MKSWFAIICVSALTALSADKSDMRQRLKIAESIFEIRFSAARIERMLSRQLDPELGRLEKVEAARERVGMIRKIYADIARDVASSAGFKEQYAIALASDLSKDALQRYLEFLSSDVGQMASEVEDRVQPLLAHTVSVRSRGRLESIPLLLAEARGS